ncbi:MAG: hypothetical protein ACREOK_10745 [Gemmatimonadaceae bacterium]
MDKDLNRDIASPSHQRPPFSDPLADGADPTSPGAPHEPGGTDYRQSKEQDNAALNATPDSEEEPRKTI